MLSSAWMRYCLILWTLDVHLCGRSPQGERGLKPFRKNGGEWRCLSLPTRGAWIETESLEGLAEASESLPTRGAWIETEKGNINDLIGEGRSPQGERGLKLDGNFGDIAVVSRSPQGERGLKHAKRMVFRCRHRSLPTRGAWIETQSSETQSRKTESLPTRGAWIET